MKAKMFVLAWAGVAGILLTAAPGCSKRAESNDVVLHDSVYIAQGDRIVAMTFDTLRKSLQGAIAQGNFEGAIAFCREQANPVTATYADSFKIRRTALRVRNPDNRPDSLELAVLDRKSTRLNSSHVKISYAVFCLKKKKKY